jgi:branched-chain amino acid transport system substrate-binding protein
MTMVVFAILIMGAGVGVGAWIAVTPVPGGGPGQGQHGDCVVDCEVTLPIGVLLDQTGELAEIGGQMVDAAQMAVDDVNAMNGGTGIKLSGNRTAKFHPIYEDSQTSTGYGKQKADKLVNVDHTPVIVGSIGSSITLAAASVTRPAEVLLFSPASTSPLLSEDDWIFRTVGADSIQALAMLDLVKALADKGKVSKKIAIYSINNAYGRGVAESLDANEEAFGLEHFFYVLYEEGQEDYTPHLQALAEARAKFAPGENVAILFTTYPLQGVKSFTSIQKLQMFPENGYQWITNDGIAWSPTLTAWPVAWAGMKGLYGTNPAAPLTDKNYSDFVEKFRAKYPSVKHPSSFAAFTYDAVLATAMAAEVAGEYTGPKVREALWKYSKDNPFRGVTGPKWWDKNGDITQQYYEIYHVKPGADFYCDNGGWWLGTPNIATSPPGTLKDFVIDNCVGSEAAHGMLSENPPVAENELRLSPPMKSAAAWRDE